MNKILTNTLSIWLTVTSFILFAQNEKEGIVYTEKVEAHINTDFLITGETLYYSIHSLDVNKNTHSTLSKLAYVELIGENGKPFLQAKIPLTAGRGAGDFFLPSALPSGNYSLIVYTKWMRNFPLEYFFQKQITIINPFVKMPATDAHRNISNTDVSSQKIKNETNHVRLVPDKKKYSQRQKVVIVMKNNDPTHDWRVSLTVYRYDKEIKKIFPSSAPTSKPDTLIRKEFITFLPDLRGETITGVVKEEGSHRPVVDRNIYMSAPGTSGIFQISKTDSTGRFYFSTKNIQSQADLRFQLDEMPASFEITLDDEFVNAYEKFKPSPLSIDTSLRKHLEQRSVYSQIENAYFIKKRDSVLNSTSESFFAKPDKIYKLDDFTRFPTMEDIFREYMYEVVVSKREGKFNLHLINTNSKSGSKFLNAPLMLVDGIRVFETETIMNYNPLLVKNISLVTRKYVYGGILFDGIMSIHTYTGNASELQVASVQKKYTPWQQIKKYYSPVYENKSLDRIPDYRVQLFWNPTITIGPGEEFVEEFYTSDVEGEFLIEAKGFNSIGEVVNMRDVIEVRK